jgi:transcription elongation factor GreB
MIDDDEDEGPPRLPGGKFYMTPEGRDRLKAEFEAVRSERHRVVEIVSWAAGNGDRSENADYKEGKRRLREIDRRLRFLTNRLAHAEIVDPAAQTQRDRVFFGATVTYANERDEEITVTIVGVDEADMGAGEDQHRLAGRLGPAAGPAWRRGDRADAARAGSAGDRRRQLPGLIKDRGSWFHRRGDRHPGGIVSAKIYRADQCLIVMPSLLRPPRLAGNTR